MNLIEQQRFADKRPHVAQATAKRPLRIKLYILLVALDLLCLVGGFLTGTLLRFGHADSVEWFGVAALVGALYGVTAISLGAYTLDVLRSPNKGTARASGALLMAFLLLFLVFYLLKVDHHISRVFTVLSFLFTWSGLILVRQYVGDWIRRAFGGCFTTEVVLVDGANTQVPTPPGAIVVNAADLGLHPNSREASMLVRFGELAQGADRVIVSCERRDALGWSRMLKGSGVPGEILTRDYEDLGPCGIGNVDGHTTLVVSTGPIDGRQRVLKRCFDLALALPALFLLSPAALIIALAIKLDSKGPVFFKQPRVGRGNALFQIYKFRTMMATKSDLLGHVSATRDDDRVTRVGRFLRRTSLDELPQLINVVLGSMSIAGPRPHALASLADNELFWHIDERYWDRHVLKPGITGLAQVRGLRGATHTREHLTSRLHADLEYTADWSLWRDIAIVVRTVQVLVHPQAY